MDDRGPTTDRPNARREGERRESTVREMGNSPSKPGSPNAAGTTECAPSTSRAEDLATSPARALRATDDEYAGNYASVMLQGFHWTSCEGGLDGRTWYAELRASIPELVKTGVNVVWLPPPSQSVSAEGYLPQSLYDLNTPYGSERELRELIAALNAAGIAPMADVVINHRCADTQDENGKWRIFSNANFPAYVASGPDDDEARGADADADASASASAEDHDENENENENAPPSNFDKTWGPWAIVKDDPCFEGEGNMDTGDVFDAAPDLDHANARVRGELTTWLRWLRDDVGFAAWRFDYARGYAAKYAKAYAADTTSLRAMNVAEYWPEATWEEDGTLATCQNPMRQSMCDWLDAADGACAAFDFATKAVLQEAVSRGEYWRLRDADGKPPGLMGWWPQRAVTFIDNHDTGGNGGGVPGEGRTEFPRGSGSGGSGSGSGSYGQGHWRFPPEHRVLGYAYILSHPGMPCLFWPHAVRMPDDSGGDMAADIARLCAIRREVGIQADSAITIVLAEADMYVARIEGAHAELAVKLGPRYDLPEEILPATDVWTLLTSGEGYALWSRPKRSSKPRNLEEELSR